MKSDLDFNGLNTFYINKVNDYLKDYFQDIKEPEQIVVSAMKYSLLNGGKRVRAVLILEFCDILGVDLDEAVKLAGAIEMIHCYSLIHDDLPCMDDDDLRRGKPSCHIKFGESIALLAGDGLLTEAFNLISNTNFSDKIKIDIIKELSRAIGHTGMIAGQAIDLCSENKNIDLDTLNRLHRLKTGKLIVASCKIASIITGKDIDTSTKYGEHIGLMFQIMDDILDVTSSDEILGKPANSDIENSKSTYVTILGLEKSKDIVIELATKSKNIVLKQYNEHGAFLCNMVEYLVNRQS